MGQISQLKHIRFAPYNQYNRIDNGKATDLYESSILVKIGKIIIRHKRGKFAYLSKDRVELCRKWWYLKKEEKSPL